MNMSNYRSTRLGSQREGNHQNAIEDSLMEKMSRLLDDKLQPINESIQDIHNEVKIALQTAQKATDIAEQSRGMAEAALKAAGESKEIANAADKTATEVCAEQEKLMDRVHQLESELNESLSQQDALHEQMLAMESYDRRNSLIFEGVPEVHNENLRQVVPQLIKNLGASVDESYLIACHRFQTTTSRNAKSKGPRPIIVKFLRYEDRKQVWQLRNKSQDGQWIREDYPTEIDRRRKAMWPYLRAALEGDPSNPKGAVSAYMRVDKLHINNQVFTYDTLEKVPPYVKERVMNPPSSKQSDTVEVFFHEQSPLSNFHKTQLVINEKQFNSVEQYLTYRKALLFQAQEVADDVLMMTEPVLMKRKTKRLPGYSESKWNEEAPAILSEALFAKFTQNDLLKQALLATDSRILGEASPGDTLFGIGLSLFNRNVLDIKKWRGRNLQGEVLMQIRQRLVEGSLPSDS